MSGAVQNVTTYINILYAEYHTCRRYNSVILGFVSHCILYVNNHLLYVCRFHMKKISSAKSGTQLPINFQNGSSWKENYMSFCEHFNG